MKIIISLIAIIAIVLGVWYYVSQKSTPLTNNNATSMENNTNTTNNTDTYTIDGRTVSKSEFETLKTSLTIDAEAAGMGTVPAGENDSGGPIVFYNAKAQDGAAYTYTVTSVGATTKHNLTKK